MLSPMWMKIELPRRRRILRCTLVELGTQYRKQKERHCEAHGHDDRRKTRNPVAFRWMKSFEEQGITDNRDRAHRHCEACELWPKREAETGEHSCCNRNAENVIEESKEHVLPNFRNRCTA